MCSMLAFLGPLAAMLLLQTAAGAVGRASYDYNVYHPFNEIDDWMSQILMDNPDMVSMERYGRTYQKRDINLIKIGERSGEMKKAIWMDCGIHAREWIAPAFCQYFIKQVLQEYRKGGKMVEMMKKLDFYVTPVLNVDGYVHSWLDNTTRLWRKSRSPGPPGCTCEGTDLNRNFNATWGTVGVSTNCCAETYGGTGPLSEPEAAAVTRYVGQRKEDFLCFLTIHSYGQLILVPYGNPNLTAPNYQELMTVGLGAADEMKKVHGKSYKVGTSPDILYPNSGSSRDWARLSGIPFSFTFELRDNGTFGFLLPQDQIQAACEEAYSGAMHIVRYVHSKQLNAAAAPAAAAASLWAALLATCVTAALAL
ncbi:unnamed protein product [Merluccius merluccius]